MKVGQHFFPRFASLLFVIITLILVGPPIAEASTQALTVKTKHAGGALEFTFGTQFGDLKVYLPDDMAAGDTISGAVYAEPKGTTDAERAKNSGVLNSYVVEIGDQKVTASKGAFLWNIPSSSPGKKPNYLLKVLASGKEVANSALPVLETGPSAAQGNFQLPTIGQQWRLVEIKGPFDGNLSNTHLSWSDSGNLSGEFARLAESPRKGIFRSTLNAAGPIQIILKESTTEIKGPYRSVAVSLSAPKTNLLKGETTTMTITLAGLKGLQEKLSFHLLKEGVVTMQGGDDQTVAIQPSEIGNDGTFTLTRTMTGLQQGNWTATVSLVPR